MKEVLPIFFFFLAHSFSAQEDFLNVYNNIRERRAESKEIQAQTVQKIQELPSELRFDTSYVRGILRHSRDSLNELLAWELQKLQMLTFPYITFSAKDGRNYTLSDFKGSDVAICFNETYCDPCFYKADTTARYAKNEDLKIIALFSDKYKNEAKADKTDRSNFLIGFIDDKTKDLITLSLGDHSAYYLNENGKIQFYDCLNQKKSE